VADVVGDGVGLPIRDPTTIVSATPMTTSGTAASRRDIDGLGNLARGSGRVRSSIARICVERVVGVAASNRTRNAAARRASSQSPRGAVVPVTVTITAITPEQEKQTITEALSLIKTDFSPSEGMPPSTWKGLDDLVYLQTPAARAELIKLLA